MPVSSAAVGKDLPTSVEEISVRRVLAYAAGIGDTSSAVFDDAGASLVAPPAFCASLEWPVVSHAETRAQLGTAADEMLRAVHVTQDSLFERPVVPGMRLATRGTVTAVRATRAGALTTFRIQTAAEDGPVVTSWYQSLYRGVEIEGEDREIAAPPLLPALERMGSLARCILPVARELPHVYTECARIWNPIHTERAVARAAGLPDIILHGTATWALAGRELVARCADGDPTRLRRLRGCFRAMVIPGTEIDLEYRTGRSPDGDRVIAFAVRNEAGDEAIAEGLAVFSAHGVVPS